MSIKKIEASFKAVGIGFISLFFLISCNGSLSDSSQMSDTLDHIEITTTFVTKPNSRIYETLTDNPNQIRAGKYHVITITKIHNPVFIEGKEISHSYSLKELLIELNPKDTIVTADNLANSDIFIKLLAYSPDYGLQRITPDQDITIRRIKPMIWQLDSKIDDFNIKGTFDFSHPQEWTIFEKS